MPFTTHPPPAPRTLLAAASPAAGAGTIPLMPPVPASPVKAFRRAVACACVQSNSFAVPPVLLHLTVLAGLCASEALVTLLLVREVLRVPAPEPVTTPVRVREPATGGAQLPLAVSTQLAAAEPEGGAGTMPVTPPLPESPVNARNKTEEKPLSLILSPVVSENDRKLSVMDVLGPITLPEAPKKQLLITVPFIMQSSDRGEAPL